jgi:hypothetical protein
MELQCLRCLETGKEVAGKAGRWEPHQEWCSRAVSQGRGMRLDVHGWSLP